MRPRGPDIREISLKTLEPKDCPQTFAQKAPGLPDPRHVPAPGAPAGPTAPPLRPGPRPSPARPGPQPARPGPQPAPDSQHPPRPRAWSERLGKRGHRAPPPHSAPHRATEPAAPSAPPPRRARARAPATDWSLPLTATRGPWGGAWYTKDFQPLPLDAPVLSLQPGDSVLVCTWKDEPLQEKWKGPHTVLLVSHTAAKVKGHKNWIHHSRLKAVPALPPAEQWTVQPITTSPFDDLGLKLLFKKT
nr:uncharacterized protein LOC125620811 [Caretta caretta]